MKKGWDLIIGGLIIVLVLCFFVPAVYAQGNITLGRLAVHPGIGVKAEFWDNIYYESEMVPGGKQEDLLYTLSPSVIMGYTGEPGNYLTFGAYSDLVAYSTNDENNYQTLSPFIYFGFKSPMGFYLRAHDNFLLTKDPFGSANSYAIGENTKRWNNKLTLSGGYEFDIYAVELMYENYLEGWDLEKNRWQDRIDHTGGVSFFYNLTEKTKLLGQYRRTIAEYEQQNDGIVVGGRRWSTSTSQDYTLNSFFIGARFEPGGKLAGEIKLGYGTKEFENERDPAGNAYEDDGDFIAETNIDYQILDRTSAHLNLQRGLLGSPDGDASSYLDTRMTFMVNQEFAYRLSASLGLDLGNQDYRNLIPGRPDKQFNIYAYIAKINYNIQDWIKAGVEYKYEHKQASDTDYLPYLRQEYKSNKFTVLLSAVF